MDSPVLLPKFQEEYSAKIPALVLLHTLGWQYLTPAQALAARGHKTQQVVLRTILRQQLQQRRFSYAGKLHPFSSDTLDKAIDSLCSPALNEGLTVANEKMYNHLVYGMAVREFVEGKKLNPTLSIIDWHNVANNQFHVTEEFTVLRQNGVDSRRPDIVCFVNGLPLAVIEAKRPDGYSQTKPTIEEGISQQLRNQRPDEIPTLFAYSQLLFAINGLDGRYATQGTDEKFWAPWQEQDIAEAKLQALKNTPLSDSAKALLFSERPADVRAWYEHLVSSGELAVNKQDRLLISLLSPERLLEFIRFYILFDQRKGKIAARYPQVFAVKKLLAQISAPADRHHSARQGGVIWHTTGSGKSFTMVFLSKALILYDGLKQCRILLVTDRIDLEGQLSTTFASGGELSGKQAKQRAIARTGKHLATEISGGTERILFTIVNKFANATKSGNCYNDSGDMVVLVDEGHRSQGGLNYMQMRRALPNAAFIAFTGTPLLKKSKTTSQFGPIVHAYTMQQAEQDKAVTPLLYEERKPELAVNEQAIDNWFERITAGLTEEQQTQLKKQYARKGYVYSAEERIQLIAYDIANHFHNNIDDGLKGQLACDSKLSAVRYKQFLDECALFESAIVMSAPDTREGNHEVDESRLPAVTKWWNDNVGPQDEKVYTREVIERFEKDDDLKLIIVVDKLLTGFDEPQNTVLYIDKPLKEHNLIQAIARVNRLHPLKTFGYLIDYRSILAELDTTVAKYQDLANKTQGGFYIEDIQGLITQMRFEYKRLPFLYTQLWNTFAGVKNTGDIEQLRTVLLPRLEDRNGEMVDVNLQVREDFYDALSQFTNCLKVAMQSADFYTDTSFNDKDRENYKEAVKQLSFLRQCAKQDAGESINYAEYDSKIKKLMDKHVVGLDIADPKGVYAVSKLGQDSPPEKWSAEKTRNETDIIRTRVTRSIEQSLRDDPYAQEVFSQLLIRVIQAAEALFDHQLKQYMLFRDFEEKVAERKVEGIPDILSGNRPAQAYFGLFKLHYKHINIDSDISTRWVDLCLTTNDVVRKTVAEYSINPQDIEANIRKQLLPIIFYECKLLNEGMDHANAIIGQIIQITKEGRK